MFERNAAAMGAAAMKKRFTNAGEQGRPALCTAAGPELLLVPSTSLSDGNTS